MTNSTLLNKTTKKEEKVVCERCKEGTKTEYRKRDSMTEEKVSGTYYRVTLLVYVLEKEIISDETAERIIRIVSEAPHGMQEKYSEQLLAMLKSCNCEEEVLRELGAFPRQSE